MTFDISNHIEFNAKNRAQCPCCLADGKKGQNLSRLANGAYKCFRGCTPEEIRAAIGAEKPRTLPVATVPPQAAKKVTVTPQKIAAANQQLLEKSTHALEWLKNRGIEEAMIAHYRLGVARARVGDSTKPQKFTHLPAIAIPIPADGDGTAYYQKKRVRPWMPTDQQPDGYSPWSQYGIPATIYTTHSPKAPTETWLCEGEWDAIVLGWTVRHSAKADHVQVSCFTCGAGNHPPVIQLETLPGKIYCFYDLDEAGEKGAKKLQKALPERILAATVPGQNPLPGWDVSDALQAGHTLDDFAAAVLAAKPYEPPQKPNPLRDRLISNDELLERAPDYTDWLIDDLLTSDELFLLAASPRAGKSLLALTLAQAVAGGGRFLGRPACQGSVIYICCEDSDTKIKEREMKQGWGHGMPVYWLDKFKFSELDYLEELVEEHEARLVVFDTLSRIRDSSTSESSAEMSQVLEPLQEMCKRQRCTGLLVHHTGKVQIDNANDVNVFDTIRGSSAIRATCRGTLVLAADERNYRLCVENGWGKMDLQVLLEANTLQWRLLGNWHGPDVDLSQKDRVLNYLTQVGSAQLNQISEATNLPKRSLYEVLKRLQSDDIVEKRGNRQSAVYARKAIQQIQQLNSLLNCSNPDRENISASIQQLPEEGGTPEKVILNSESDPNKDHFLGSPPTPHTWETVDKNAETQAGQAIPNSTTIQHGINTDKKSDPKPAFDIGDRVMIDAAGSLRGQICNVIDFNGQDTYVVWREGWAVCQEYALSDLLPVHAQG